MTYVLLTNTPDAPRARALKTSVPLLTPPSKNTGIRPCAALTTYKPSQQSHNLKIHQRYSPRSVPNKGKIKNKYKGTTWDLEWLEFHEYKLLKRIILLRNFISHSTTSGH